MSGAFVVEAFCLCLGQLRQMEAWLVSTQKGAVGMDVKIKEWGMNFTAWQQIAKHPHFVPCLCSIIFPMRSVLQHKEVRTVGQEMVFLSEQCQTLLSTWRNIGNDKALPAYMEMGIECPQSIERRQW